MTDTKKREDVTLLINDEEYRLRMTLGAMAALERELGAQNISDLQERLSNPSMNDIQAIALVLIRGGGENVPDNFFMTAAVDFKELMAAVMEATKRAFSTGKEPARGNAKRA